METFPSMENKLKTLGYKTEIKNVKRPIKLGDN